MGSDDLVELKVTNEFVLTEKEAEKFGSSSSEIVLWISSENIANVVKGYLSDKN